MNKMSKVKLSVSHAPPAPPEKPLDQSLRGYLETHAAGVVAVDKEVRIEDVGALSAQAEDPVLFNNIKEYPDFRLVDMLFKNRRNHARVLGVPPENYLKTLAYRLRQPPRGFKFVDSGPVKEVILTGDEADLTKLPVPLHKEGDELPVITAMCIAKDPETGFYNTCNAATAVAGPRRGLMSFVTSHTRMIMRKYLDMGHKTMPVAQVIGVHPAYEIATNFSGLHMDSWGELEMVGTVMDQDIEMVKCETLDLYVPAHAEIVIEGNVNIEAQFETGTVTAPSLYRMPREDKGTEMIVSAITMRADRPIYRNHQTCPTTDHQALPRMCHEAILYNRLSEMGIDVKEVRFPLWGAALSCVIQINYPWDGFVNDALMMCMGAPWINTKLVVAISPDTDIESAEEIYTAIASRCDPSRDLVLVDRTRGSLYDPSAAPVPEAFPFRLVGKMGIDATIKTRHDKRDFEWALPVNWGKVWLKDYL